MIGDLKVDSKGNVESPVSLWQPPEEIKNLTARIRQDYETGYNILHKPYREFNDRNLVQVMNDDQSIFNSYTPARSQDPNESWKAQTIRPLTRNKIISIAAHMIARLLVPQVFAQNDQDEEDKQASNVMRDLIKFVIKNSDYEDTFLFAVIAACVNPAVILEAKYAKAMQTIRERHDDGTITIKEVVDEVLSGFSTSIVPVDELLINNIYENDIQRQKCLIRQKFINYDEAEGLYSEHSNWEHIRPGIKTFYSEDNGMFYEEKDDEHPTLVEEVTYYNRREDLELIYVNGILMSDKDQPMKHRRATKDQHGNHVTVPHYQFAKSGYEPIDEKRFFYYKSVVSKLGNDQLLLDTMWNMTLDGTFLRVIPPINIFGDTKSDNQVVIPGASNYFAKDARMEPFNAGSDLSAGYSGLQILEDSMSESSQDPTRSGQRGEGGRTAREVLIQERNARVQLGLFGTMMANLVTDFGGLMVDDIIMHMTVPEVEELTGGETRMKFRTYLLPNETRDGKTVTKKIKFTIDVQEMTDEELTSKEFSLLKEECGMEGETSIYMVNPARFSTLGFELFVSAEERVPQSEELEKALKLEAYDRMIQNPTLDQDAVTRDFLVEVFAPGAGDKYKRVGVDIPEAPPGNQGGNLVSQMTGRDSLQALTT